MLRPLIAAWVQLQKSMVAFHVGVALEAKLWRALD